jgi:pilus assembly protein CpaF
VVSGGTGSGKTTMLNAISEYIDAGERVVTIEDAAELQLKQPHVLRLETRPANMEGHGAITQRPLLKNALRMRPDRIILGEIRGDEVIDVLQAMNTGHEGSMATIHSNSARDCLTRIENLVGMSGITLPTAALRQQIASAIHLIVQVQRMRDGVRRVVSITEVVGNESDIITTQELFSFTSGQMGTDGKLKGKYKSHHIRPSFRTQVEYFGLLKELDEALELVGGQN